MAERQGGAEETEGGEGRRESQVATEDDLAVPRVRSPCTGQSIPIRAYTHDLTSFQRLRCWPAGDAGDARGLPTSRPMTHRRL